MTTVLCVPQWQGSGATRAPRLVDGARRSAELCAADGIVMVPVLDSAGEKRDGVRALDVLVENLRRTTTALAGIHDFVITVGGDCGVDLAPIAAARAEYGEALTVLWIDAHPDLYTPATLPSGSFHGMVVSTLLGDGPAELVPAQPLTPDQVILVGIRTGDPAECEYIEKAGIRHHGVADLDRALDGLTGPVYIHIDLDVLDPDEFGSTCYPVPDGIPAQRLVDLVSRVDTVVGAAVTEHAPVVDNPAEADVLTRLGAALRR